MGVVRVDGHEVAGVIRAFADNAMALGDKLPVVADMLVAAVEDVYDAQGPGWEPLAESTLERRRGGSGKILQDTGQMVQSTMSRYGSDYAEAYAHVPYASYHARGHDAGPNYPRLPRRNPFDISPFEDTVLADIGDLLSDEVLK